MGKFKTVKPGCSIVMKMDAEVTRNDNKEGDREENLSHVLEKSKKVRKYPGGSETPHGLPKVPPGRN